MTKPRFSFREVQSSSKLKKCNALPPKNEGRMAVIAKLIVPKANVTQKDQNNNTPNVQRIMKIIPSGYYQSK